MLSDEFFSPTLFCSIRQYRKGYGRLLKLKKISLSNVIGEKAVTDKELKSFSQVFSSEKMFYSSKSSI